MDCESNLYLAALDIGGKLSKNPENLGARPVNYLWYIFGISSLLCLMLSTEIFHEDD